jgi:uroporphyrin-3 C-methyltransferase
MTDEVPVQAAAAPEPGLATGPSTAVPAATAAAPAAPVAQPDKGRGSPAWLQFALLITVIALAASGWQWWEMRSRVESLQEELARRLAEGDSIAKESRLVAKQGQESLASLQAKLGALEAKLAESQSQQVALESMYQELARNRDDRVLAEVDQALNLAGQQLLLAGNVESALIALQSADARLARTEQAQFLPLRKALNQDIDRLKALPLVDIPGLALKVDSVITAVDSMPLAFEGKGREEELRSARQAPASGFWSALGRDLWAEVSQLVRIERLERPDPGVLSPQNAFVLRENLKLRLMSARLSLVQRDAASFRQDLRQARVWIERYFDVRAKSTQDALATLQQLASAPLSLELPSLDESVTALRSFKLGRDKGMPATAGR